MAGFLLGVPKIWRPAYIFSIFAHYKEKFRMNNNGKLLLWGSLVVAVLAALIVFLFLNLSKGDGEGDFVLAAEEISVYSAIPTDAVMVVDIKHFGEYAQMSSDTLSFLYGLSVTGNPLVEFQRNLSEFGEVSAAPVVMSMHYSAKNEVSFLQIMDLKNGGVPQVQDLLSNSSASRKRYNGVVVYTLGNGLVAAIHNNLLLASSSSHVLESSVRHLENKTSIIDKQEFEKLLRRHGAHSSVYVNHNQIGKLFSGMVDRGFLGYSDFFMKFTSWSSLSLSSAPDKLTMKGVFDNASDDSRFSNIFESQGARKSQMGKILPASSVFAVSIPVSSMHEFLKSHNLYLEMQKKVGQFAFKQKSVQGENAASPMEWVDSLAIEELVSAYCKFGEKCEWIIAFREKQHFGLDNVISSVVDREKPGEPEQFRYKGYIASVFGELFSHCSEDYSCKVGPWTVVGPKAVIDEYAAGRATYFTLEDYIGQTPVEGWLDKEASLKLVANIKEAGDSLLQVFKPYYRAAVANQMVRNNFEMAVMDLSFVEGEPVTEIDFYGCRLVQLPKPVEKEGQEEITFAVDSTIALEKGPFEVKDVAKKSAAYLEQLPNMRLRYMDANKKGVWAIPFDTPVCGYVEQIDLYGNGRLQMLFASEDKLYLLDRLGRFVNGYPKKLHKKVVMGPKLVRNVNGIKYSILVLNDDNTVSWLDISGKPVAGWSDIVAPEFIKELPKFAKLGGKRYWILKAPSQLLLYTIDGKMIDFPDKKKKIDRESEIEFVQDGILKVKCTDGREYTWNLETGKIKKLK